VKLFPLDLPKPRRYGFVLSWISLHFIVLQKKWLQPMSINQISARECGSDGVVVASEKKMSAAEVLKR
jgi:hypothetical protein